jgi:DNA topoisomerase-1
VPTALVIVESPAKAKTIAGYLGSDYVVESSIGHVRDLPRNAADVPAAYKNESWARLGIDVDNDFKPLYVISSDRKDQIKKLRSLVKDVDEIYLATDEDREGEAIAWHLLEVLIPRAGQAHGVPRDHPRRPFSKPSTIPASSIAVWSTRKKRGACSIGSTAMRCRRFCGRRSCRGCRPAACRASRRASSSNASESACVRHRALLGSDRDVPQGSVNSKKASPVRSRATLTGLDGKRVATGRDFRLAGQDQVRLMWIVLAEAASPRSCSTTSPETNFSVNSVEIQAVPSPACRRRS